MSDPRHLNRIAYFAAVVETGSFTAAAARLGITKAVVSQQVAKLEEEVGASLLVRTTRTGRELTPEDHVRIDWGDEFAERYQAAFPKQQSPVMSISYGPLALDYILVVGGSGYFREGFVRPWLEDGSLEIMPGSPEFSYSAYAVHSTKADEGVMARIRTGLRAATALTL